MFHEKRIIAENTDARIAIAQTVRNDLENIYLMKLRNYYIHNVKLLCLQ